MCKIAGLHWLLMSWYTHTLLDEAHWPWSNQILMLVYQSSQHLTRNRYLPEWWNQHQQPACSHPATNNQNLFCHWKCASGIYNNIHICMNCREIFHLPEIEDSHWSLWMVFAKTHEQIPEKEAGAGIFCVEPIFKTTDVRNLSLIQRIPTSAHHKTSSLTGLSNFSYIS